MKKYSQLEQGEANKRKGKGITVGKVKSESFRNGREEKIFWLLAAKTEWWSVHQQPPLTNRKPKA